MSLTNAIFEQNLKLILCAYASHQNVQKRP